MIVTYGKRTDDKREIPMKPFANKLYKPTVCVYLRSKQPRTHIGIVDRTRRNDETEYDY